MKRGGDSVWGNVVIGRSGVVQDRVTHGLEPGSPQLPNVPRLRGVDEHSIAKVMATAGAQTTSPTVRHHFPSHQSLRFFLQRLPEVMA